jgi:hypothetical protein
VDPQGEIQQASFQAGFARTDGFVFLLFGILQFHLGLRVTPIAKGQHGLFDGAEGFEQAAARGVVQDGLFGPFRLFPVCAGAARCAAGAVGSAGGVDGGHTRVVADGEVDRSLETTIRCARTPRETAMNLSDTPTQLSFSARPGACDPEQLARLLGSVSEWNEWREANYEVPINLAGADLHGAALEGAMLAEADLTDADLSGAKLAGASFYKTLLGHANLSSAVTLRSTPS